MNMIKEALKLEEQYLLEMARMGFIDNDKYEIWIHTDDPGNIPHMHIWDYSTKGDNFHTCVRLDKAEYFHHTGKEDVLNSKMRKSLIKFLKQSYSKEETMWKHILRSWNENNSFNTAKVDINQEMPDYTKL